MEDKNEVFKIIPKYNFIYELGMPTGRKVANTLKMLIILIILYIIYLVVGKNLDVDPGNKLLGISVLKVLDYIFLIVIALLILKTIFDVVIQVIQYSSISYTFYDKHLVYDDKFLNQHIKTIQYSNIREIEIRKNIWDRLNGFGIIIIYTNAENEYKNGLVILGIKNPNMAYEKINSIIHQNNNTYKENNDIKNNIVDSESDFKDSLK